MSGIASKALNNGSKINPTKTEPAAPKMAENTRSWNDIFFEFTQNTTIHGIRYVFDRESVSKFRRILWLMLFLTAATFFLNQITERIIYFNDAPVTVKVEVNFNKTLRFPALLLCNQNSFRITQAEKLGVKDMLDEFYELEEGDPRRLDILVNYNMANRSLEKLMLDTAHQVEDMIVKCKWKGKKCDHTNFTQVLTDHGVCFSFNSDPSSSPLFIAESGSKETTSLTLYLNIEQYENMIGPNFAAGIKLLLFDDKEISIFKGQGQGLAAGSHTFAGTSVVVMQRLDEPYGNCSDSHKLDFYPEYSERACFVECFTKFYTSNIDCRMPYMQGTAPVCTLYQHARWHRQLQIEFDRLQETICKCPPPCRTLTYKPRFTYLKASDFDIHKLLKGDIVEKLSRRYIAARDTLRASDAVIKEKDAKIVDEFISRGGELAELTSPAGLLLAMSLVRNATQNVERNMKSIVSDIMGMYAFQRFNVRKNFYRFTQYNDEMYFSEVADGYLEFITNYVENLRKLKLSNDINGGVTDRGEFRVTSVEDQLDAKLKVIDLSLVALYRCVIAYVNGTIPWVSPYRYRDMSTDAHAKITPKKRLYKACTKGFDAFSQSYTRDGFYKSLFALKEFYKELNETAHAAYHGDFTEATGVALREEYIRKMSDYLGNRSILMTDIFHNPLKGLDRYIAELRDIYQKVVDGFDKNLASLETIEKVSNRNITQECLDMLNEMLGYANFYRSSSREKDSVNKMQLAEDFIEPFLGDVIQNIYGYLGDVSTAVEDMISTWTEINNRFSDILLRLMYDEDTKSYRRAYRPTWVDDISFNNSDESRNIHVDRDRAIVDLGFIAERTEEIRVPFKEAFYAMVKDLRDYHSSNTIDVHFYKENFISLVIYFEDMNYQLIEQQAAYTIFALLSDIGGSMGLFVGGSVISLFELIDVFLYNQIYLKVDKERKKRAKKKESGCQVKEEDENNIKKVPENELPDSASGKDSPVDFPRDKSKFLNQNLATHV